MTPMKKKLTLLAVATLVISYTGSTRALAVDHYYFADLPGLILNNDVSAPFCAKGTCNYEESQNVDLGMNASSQDVAISDTNVANMFTHLPSAPSLTVRAYSDDESIVSNDDISTVGNTINISKFLAEGTSKILVRAEATDDNRILDETSYDVNVSDALSCNSLDPLDGIECEDGTCDSTDDIYLIGGLASSSAKAKDQLICISNYQDTIGATGNPLTAKYKLTADVTFSGAGEDWDITATDDDAAGWKPLGSDRNHKFMGSFDGGGNHINNLYIRLTNNSEAGLFGYMDDANISNLALNNVDIIVNSSSASGAMAGGIAGYGYSDCVISKVSVTGNLTAISSLRGARAGGILGAGYYTNVSQASADVNVYAESNTPLQYISDTSTAGGIMGSEADGTNIDNCVSHGSIESKSLNYISYAGGIVGDGGTINNSYSTATVVTAANASHEAYAGGTIGHIPSNNTYNVYSDWTTEPSIIAGSTNYTGTTAGYLSINKWINNGGFCEYSTETSPLSICSDSDIYEIHANNTEGASAWSGLIWDNLGTSRRPTLKNMPN